MPVEPYPLVLYVHYAGFAVFAIGLALALGVGDPKWKQRATYLICATGFLMIWGGGHLSTEFSEREIFTVPNVLGFLVIVGLMNLAHYKAANAEGSHQGGGRWTPLRIFGAVEGMSLIVLMFVAMPLKYLAEFDAAVRYVGMAHGIFFMVFVVWVLWAARRSRWSIEKTFGALVASVIPFGPFIADLAE